MNFNKKNYLFTECCLLNNIDTVNFFLIYTMPSRNKQI